MVAVPSESAFSPLPELIGQFGLPNPLTFLGDSQNQLEDGFQASGDWRSIAGQLRGTKDELRTAVSTVQWHGAAGTQMRQQADEDIEELERRIEELEEQADNNDDSGNLVIKIISTILIILASLVTILAVTFAIACAAAPWSFGVSLTLWVAEATGLSLSALTAITGAIAGALAILSGLLTLVQTWS